MTRHTSNCRHLHQCCRHTDTVAMSKLADARTAALNSSSVTYAVLAAHLSRPASSLLCRSNGTWLYAQLQKHSQKCSNKGMVGRMPSDAASRSQQRCGGMTANPDCKNDSAKHC
jgi:hypothetical protein